MKNKKWYQRPFLWLFLTVLVYIPTEMWMKLPRAEVDKFFEEAPTLIEEKILVKYPEDLTIKVDKGKVELNKNLPYCLVVEETEGEKTGIIFDKNPRAEDLRKAENEYSNLCKTVGMVGEDYVVFPDDKGIKVEEIPTEISVEINKEQLNMWVEKYLPMVKKWGFLAYQTIPFLLVPVVMMALLITNFWYGLVLVLMGKLLKIKDLTSGVAYKISLLIFTFWTAFKWLVGIIIEQTNGKTVSLSPFVFFDTILITAIGLFLIKNEIVEVGEKKEKEPEAKQ
ncbi:hypothetical protein KJ909_02330 [Patescibacteria group bacterium]|nr:hypothetical protein [Patescibacteria group bacterium]